MSSSRCLSLPEGTLLLSFGSSGAGSPQMGKGLSCILQKESGGGVLYSAPGMHHPWADVILHMYAVENRGGGNGSGKGVNSLCQAAWLY